MIADLIKTFVQEHCGRFAHANAITQFGHVNASLTLSDHDLEGGFITSALTISASGSLAR